MKSIAFMFLLIFFNCSKNNMNERDIKKEQVHSTAQIKKQELKLVEGEYYGLLKNDDVYQASLLILEVKDIPISSGAEMDPILIPTLKGSLKIFFGDPSHDECYTFVIEKSDFDVKNKVLNLTSNELNLSFDVSDSFKLIKGSWATNTGTRFGSLSLKKDTEFNLSEHPLISSIKGNYEGSLKNTSHETNLSENLKLSVVTTKDFSAPYGLKISTSLRFYFGPLDSDEYSEAKCETVQIDFFTHQFALKCDLPNSAGFIFMGTSMNHRIVGKLSYDGLGEIGEFDLKK